jgi:divinyl chlorophyllide a 8-vinyl-reductase
MTLTHADISVANTIAGSRKRVLVIGATGTIGRATVRALINQGYEVICFVRQRAGAGGALLPEQTTKLFDGASIRYGDVSNPASLKDQGFKGESFDVLVSCLASRTGNPKDAWAIDHQAHMHVLEAAKRAGVNHFVLLSAICVQKPLLAFQHAKLAFEKALIQSGMTYSIVRPTAFFKSLSGQLERVKKGKPFLLFGDGTLTACKPISDNDLGDYITGCIHDQTRHNRILPIGGPGAAITPREQGEKLFELLGQEVRFKQIPVAMMDVIIAVLSFLGRVIPSLADKAELARIGRYYATESMLVWDAQSGSYDAAATPSTGTQTLFDFYADLVKCGEAPERGDHAVF